ncbi:MAG: hypothetical protein IPL61_38700 [Myxococcales bacterium]|nr:hypothetical protein [Myxococcales bacterium]
MRPRQRWLGALAALALTACSLDQLPPTPADRARVESARADRRVAAMVRELPGVRDVRALVVLTPDDPLAPGPRPLARATVTVVIGPAAEPTAVRAAATAAARTVVARDAEVTVIVLAAPLPARSRRTALLVLALAVAAAAAALALALSRRRALARYRGIRPQ